MKKYIIIMILALMPGIISAQVGQYKGFVDLFAGTGFVGGGSSSFSVNGNNYSNIHSDLMFGFNVTGGYQITEYLFAGVGFGGYTSMMGYDYSENNGGEWRESAFHSIYLPVFADVRWTLNIERKITPFVDLKLGYQFGVCVGTGEIDYWNGEDQIMAKYKNGFFLQPGFGVRFGRMSAFNLGLAYNVSIPTVFEKVNRYDATAIPQEIISCKGGALMLTFGADF